MNSASASDLRRPRSRSVVWILVGLFFAPLLIAFGLYYGLPGLRPAGSTNHGDLITPARPLPELPLEVAEVGGTRRGPVPLWQGKWSFVFVGSGDCDERCRTALIDMRQVRLALNDDMQRVQRVFLATGECCEMSYLEQQHPGLLLARLSAAQQRSLLAPFPRYPEGEPDHAGRIYIVDPLGSLMMSYSAQAPAKGLLEDMKKLLKLSHIG
jgi:cytochrome oxidase Cu insertion factor (SCO1/SenC/PrrC family)